MPRASATRRGDLNCDGSIDQTDILIALQLDSGITPDVPAGCDVDGKFDCNDDDPTLAVLHLLWFEAGITPPVSGTCVPIGSEAPTLTPTPQSTGATESATPTPSSTPTASPAPTNGTTTPTPTPTHTPTPSPTPTPTATATPTPTPSPSPSPSPTPTQTPFPAPTGWQPNIQFSNGGPGTVEINWSSYPGASGYVIYAACQGQGLAGESCGQDSYGYYSFKASAGVPPANVSIGAGTEYCFAIVAYSADVPLAKAQSSSPYPPGGNSCPPF